MISIADKIRLRISVDANGCWLWQGAKAGKGYGVVKIPLVDRLTYTHRAMYEDAVGTIPEGMQIDHLCRVPACCNPAHLEAVAPVENTRRGRSVEASHLRRGRAKQCPQGHAFTDENSYFDGAGYRSCRACRAAKKRPVTAILPHKAATSPASRGG